MQFMYLTMGNNAKSKELLQPHKKATFDLNARLEPTSSKGLLMTNGITTLLIREMEIRAGMRQYHTHTHTLKIAPSKTPKISADKDVEKPLCTAGKNAKWHNHYEANMAFKTFK